MPPCHLLRVLQLNIGGFTSTAMGQRRKLQLEAILHREQITVCCLQESNLGPKAELPRFRGFTVLRQDRRFDRDGAPSSGVRGFGGVLTLIKEGIQFERLPSPIAPNDRFTDVIAARVYPPPPYGAVTITNVYRPPIRPSSEDARDDAFDPSLLPGGPRSIVLGDFNAHHPSWDPFKPADDFGETLDRWASDTSMLSINTGVATRVDPASGAPSSPDVTFVPARLGPRCDWSCLEDVSSDHLPLLTVVRMGHPVAENKTPILRWREKKANWDIFTESVDRQLSAVDPDITPIQALRLFEQVLHRARACSCLLYTSPSPRDGLLSRMPSSA